MESKIPDRHCNEFQLSRWNVYIKNSLKKIKPNDGIKTETIKYLKEKIYQ